jgi:hypothetical protein
LKAAVYAELVRRGGGGVRNWLADVRTKGVTTLHNAPRASGLIEIGSRRHLPGKLLVE